LAPAWARLTLSIQRWHSISIIMLAKSWDMISEADLMDLGLSAEQISKLQPSSACLQMMGLEYLYVPI